MTWREGIEYSLPAIGIDLNMYSATHYTYEGNRWEGPAKWWVRLRGMEKAEDYCMTWPAPGSIEHQQLEDFAVANAALLGAVFTRDDEDGWSVQNQKLRVGRHTYKGDAAQSFLSLHRWWCAYNHGTKQWELVRQ